MKFHPGEIAVQTRAGVTEDAADVGEGIIDHVPEAARDFLAPRRMVVIATIDAYGRVWASVVTGEPGFLSLLDDRNVRIAALPSGGDPLLENLTVEGHVALFIPDFVAPRRIRLNGRGQIKGGEIHVRAEQVYGNCRRYIQERLLVGTRPSSDALRMQVTRATKLSAQDRDQILRADTFFIATEHPDAGADVSHKGGNPGFVKVLDDQRIAFPDYNGNHMFNTLGNLAMNPNAGLLFIDFDSGRTLQLTGAAAIDWNPERVRDFAGAERIVDFEVAQVVANECGFPLITKFRQYSRFNPA
jgi:predicted pyridoxine 5'-phosphate oxidase superfamily flavin-nucleotide-binding protein